jgi:hypothetical protein
MNQQSDGDFECRIRASYGGRVPRKRAPDEALTDPAARALVRGVPPKPMCRQRLGRDDVSSPFILLRRFPLLGLPLLQILRSFMLHTGWALRGSFNVQLAAVESDKQRCVRCLSRIITAIDSITLVRNQD